MDLLPWVAFAAGVMALVTQFPWGQRREGIGGALAKDVDGKDVVRVVPRPTVKDPPAPRRPTPARSGNRPLAQPTRPPEPAEPPAPASPSRIAEEVSLVGGGVTEDAEGLLVHRARPPAAYQAGKANLGLRPHAPYIDGDIVKGLAGETDVQGKAACPATACEAGKSDGCTSRSSDYGSCIVDGILVLANGVGTLLLATGVGSEVGAILIGINVIAQLVEIAVDIDKLNRGEISREHFNLSRTMNLIDMIPGLGALSGIFSLMDKCELNWAFEWSPNSPDKK
jgi:hypothetical protein